MKKLITIMMVAFAAVAAKADLTLYWQVADETFHGTYAVLQGIDSTGTATGLAGMKLGTSGVTTVESLILPYSDYRSYIVELLDASGNTLAVSQTYAQGTLESFVYNRGSSDQPPKSPWQVSAFTIPEPTSALMLLVGIVGLALKRKNA